jgi:hypothetical protein
VHFSVKDKISEIFEQICSISFFAIEYVLLFNINLPALRKADFAYSSFLLRPSFFNHSINQENGDNECL